MADSDETEHDETDPLRPTITASEFGKLPQEPPAEHAAWPQQGAQEHGTQEQGAQAHGTQEKQRDAPREPGGPPQPGDVIAERYRIERELDRGGMGTVYAATQVGKREHLGKVALKWLIDGDDHRTERHRRFLREARTLGSIQHPNVVRVYDAGEHDKGVFLVMELLEGESLRVCMQRTTLTAAQAVDLLMPALRGIAAVHKKGIVHRDLKPDNIFVCKSDDARPSIKVLDFGLSKLLGMNADSLETLPGAMLGTPQYMAPEQALGLPVDERSDIYSLGVILYEAVAGCRPFEALTLAGLLVKLARAEPPHLLLFAKNAPVGFADAVMRALHRDPAQRPSNVEAFARELEPYGSMPFVSGESYGRLSRLSAPFLATAPARSSQSSQSRRTAWWIAAVIAAALLGALAEHRWSGARQAEHQAEREAERDTQRVQATAVAPQSQAQPSTLAPPALVLTPIAQPVVEPTPPPVAPATQPTTASKPARWRAAHATKAHVTKTHVTKAPARTPREVKLETRRASRGLTGIVDPWEEPARPDPSEGVRKD